MDDFCELGTFVPHGYYMLVEAFAEVAISSDTPPPTREEFRAICDEHESVEDIVAALETL
jgi:hypothetical protein